MKKQLTRLRLIIALVTMALEQLGIYALWRWLLPLWGVSLGGWVVILAMSLWLIAGTFLYVVGLSAIGKKELPGFSSMLGMEGKTVGALEPTGVVNINGELWSAHALEGSIASGKSIIVTGEDGLKLIVRKKN